jgi:hypothetical protein
MRLYLIALLSACLSLSAMAAPAGYTTIMATNVVDAGGNPLVSGTATFQVMDATGHQMSVQLGGYGQVHTEKVSVPVINGAFTAQVVDVSQTSPSYPCVALTIVDNNTGTSVLSYNCLQPTGGTFDLDMFSTSTTPVSPQAGSTVLGNLGVNGNLNVTGTLNIGGLNVGNLTTAVITAQNLNGMLDASAFTGSDIGAKVNNAFASITSGGTVHIPSGSYSFSTTMVIPDSVTGVFGYHIDCDPGAVMTYTGTGNAIQLTNDIPGAAEVGIDGHGGCLLVSATTGVGSGIDIPPSNATYVTGMKIKKFANGVYLPGGNAVEIFNNVIQSNTCGICSTTVNPTGLSGFSANALHIHDNEISSNGWGYHSINSGVSASHALGNDIRDNIFEGNTIGDIDDDWDAHLMVVGNYFESAGVAVAAGQNNNVYDLHVEGNYFTSNAYRSEIEIGFGWDFFISNNYEEGSAGASTGCKVNSIPGGGGGNVNIVAVNAFAQNSEGHAGGTTPTLNELCLHGTPVVTLGGTQRVENNLAVAGNTAMNGTLGVSSTIFGDTSQSASTFPTTPQIMAIFGSLTIWSGPAAPGGVCGGAAAVFYYSTGWSMCVSGNWVAK